MVGELDQRPSSVAGYAHSSSFNPQHLRPKVLKWKVPHLWRQLRVATIEFDGSTA